MDGIYRKQEDEWMGYIENKKMNGWDKQKTRRWMDGIYRKQEDEWMGYIENKKWMDRIYRKQEDGWLVNIEKKTIDGWDIQKVKRWKDEIYII